MTLSGPILVIEDDSILGPAMVQRLRLEGYAVDFCETGQDAIKQVAIRKPALVISDIRLPDRDGEAVFGDIINAIGLVPFYFITAFGDISQAVRLVKAGASDYLTKPLDMDSLIAMIRAVVWQEPSGDPAIGAGEAASALGISSGMAAVEALCRKVARTSLPILLTGETGTGKEVVARFLHSLGQPDSPFVPVNCAAIPRDLAESVLFGHEKGAFTGAMVRKPGLVEAASAGTLFLDEIGELPLDLQAKLLRLAQENTYLAVGAVEEKRFSGRLVCATHADLAARVAAGSFREDLYYRINVVTIHVPALRERRADIRWLAEKLLGKANRGTPTSKSFTAAALNALEDHSWPGNVRELRNRVERAAAMAEGLVILAEDLFPELAAMPAAIAPPDTSLRKTVDLAMRARILDALKASVGNRTAAARILGISRTSLWKKMRDLGIAVSEK